jgi:hypothetical protein
MDAAPESKSPPPQAALPAPTVSPPRGRRVIAWFAVCAMVALAAGSLTLRAVAQSKNPGTPESVPKDAPPPASSEPADAQPEAPRRAAPPKSSDEEAPEFRESADNNISLPVDI